MHGVIEGDDDNDGRWVAYGTAFSDDETGLSTPLSFFPHSHTMLDADEGRFRALQQGKRRMVPAAYEQRVLNERGKPMRFHGAFTGGFSAGYFNTVGSKEGSVFCSPLIWANKVTGKLEFIPNSSCR